MSQTEQQASVISRDDVALVTGATGFIGPRVVQNLVNRGFRRVRVLVRPSASSSKTKVLLQQAGQNDLQVIYGNLLSMDDCIAATEDARVIIHLAAGRGEKSIPDAYLNSVVTTRNLLEASLLHRCLLRFVNLSSFSVYANDGRTPGKRLDETWPVEQHPERRGDAYSFAKARQEELVVEYSKKYGIPCVMIRPGWVYGPGNTAITGRVGIGSFGVFLHLGGSNRIPLSYVDNCAEAITLAALVPGVDGEVFNIVDDDLLSSRQLLRLYKRHVRRFSSLYVPKFLSYSLCYFWERYSAWSEGQLPPAFNRCRWNSFWRKTYYSNDKLKKALGWMPIISTQEGLRRYFEACRRKDAHA